MAYGWKHDVDVWLLLNHVSSCLNLLMNLLTLDEKYFLTQNPQKYRIFPYTVALSLELLRSFARRTHREVSDAFSNIAPANCPPEQVGEEGL